MFMMRSYVLAAAGALSVFTTVSPSAAEGLPTETRKLLPAALAVEVAQTAIATCKGQGYNVTVSIVDRSGVPQLLIAGDGAGTLTREVARRKAYTAATLRISTADFAKRVAGGGFNPSVFDNQLVTAVGGVPVKVGDETIAGLGVSGAPGGDKDEACADAGLAKIRDRLQ
jgi:uncharacterized protein GlcG (DUF336 family)